MHRFLLSFVFLSCLLVWSVNQAGAAWQPAEGKELIGTPAPQWQGLTWINSPALTVADLRGKVILVRFWSTECSMCANTAPALNLLHTLYGRDGLAIVGIHHPKSPAGRNIFHVRETARRLGFKFPIAQDAKWTTVKMFWLHGKNRTYTSAAFLIDRRGKIRWLHGGGEFHQSPDKKHAQCNAAYSSLEKTIRELLAEPF